LWVFVMTAPWLIWANWILAALAALMSILAFGYWISSSQEETLNVPKPISTTIPKNPFEMDPAAYEAIGHPSFQLEFSPLKPQLPDLRRFLTYHGKNGRPDAIESQTAMHFSSLGQKSFASVLPSERLYLVYDKTLAPPQYLFSPHNNPTSIWFTAKPEGAFATLDVYAIDENGQRLTAPPGNLQIKLPEKELARVGGANAGWEIDGQRVDAALFVRQKARWFGPDRFLEQHGGDEFASQAGKQRLDFDEKEEGYSVYLDPKDVLIWKDKHWQAVAPGVQSQGSPLAVIKKIDDRIMTLELWDPDGKNKTVINLIKSGEAWNSQVIQQTFTYEGARTRRQFIFDVAGERLLLSPNDWLLLTPEGWKKLSTAIDIDSYVARRLTGILFIFFGVERHEGKQYLMGELYSPARSDMQKVELQLKTGSKPMAAPLPKGDIAKRIAGMPMPPNTSAHNGSKPAVPVKHDDHDDDESYSSSDWDSSEE
jgi:hypothetical protein